MSKLPKNRLCVGKTNQGIPFAFVAEHLVSAIQNPYAAHIVWIRLDSGESIIAEHTDGLVGLLRWFDIEVSAQWIAELNVPKEQADVAKEAA